MYKEKKKIQNKLGKKNVSPKPPSSTQNKDIDAHWYAENKRPCVLDVLQMNYYRLDFFICFVFFFLFLLLPSPQSKRVVETDTMERSRRTLKDYMKIFYSSLPRSKIRSRRQVKSRIKKIGRWG
ncbi:Uncharacterized protein APZ42_003001 [Daphnia magna]|uniref:Uncharacterized protein n=1 Tax=Daphnia magna TaxID=35525 RepID=A0A164HWK1_9CRUS|nr:Uncharacterized protein APZ42_003001 [Daphnia magna]